MKWYRHLLLSPLLPLVLLSFVDTCQGQDEYQLVKHLTTENGLPSNHVYSVIKDKDGFLWFATDQGVVKYDGSYLRTFTTNDGLTQNDIFDLKEDGRGRIWAFNKAPEICYIKDDQVTTINSKIEGFDFESFQEDNNGIIFNNYNSMVFEEDDSLTYDGGEDRKFIDFTFEHYDFTFEHYDLKIRAINREIKLDVPIYVGDSRIFTLAQRYIGFFDPMTQKLRVIDTKSGKQLLAQFQGKANKYGLYKLRANKDHFQLVVKGGLWEYHPMKDSLSQVTSTRLNEVDAITSFVKIDDLLAISSLTHGVLLYKKTTEASINRQVKVVRETVVLGQHLIVGDDSGSIYAVNEDLEVSQEIKPSVDKAFNSNIKTIHHDAAERVLSFASSHLGIQVLSYNGEIPHLKFDTIFWDKARGSIREIIYEDKVYATHKHGIWDMYENGDAEQVFSSQFTPNHAITLNDSIMWLGQNKQIIRLNFLDRTWQHYSTSYNVTKIQPSHKHLLLGTDGQGVFLFNPRTKSSKSLLEKVSVTDIEVDSNLVAISSTSGIYLLDAKKEYKLVKHLYKGNPLTSDRINLVNFLNGRLIAFSNEGAQSIDLQSLNDTLNTRVYIDHPTLNHNNEIRLDSSRTLQFTIRKIDYEDRVLDYYVSMVKKGNADNFELSNSPSTRFVGLSPGTHILKIYGQEKYSQQRTPAIERVIIVKHKIYEYMLFKLLLLALISLSVLWFFRRRLRKISEANEEQLQIERTYAGIELQALQSQLNPHFVFNCLGSIQALIKDGETKFADAYLIKFSKLMRMFLEQSSSHVTTLANEIEVNRLYLELEKLRFKEKLGFNITVDESVTDLSTPIPAVFVQPFVENAIRHGIFHMVGKGHIDLNIYKENEILKIEISDNGIGIEKSKKLKEKSSLSHNSKSLAIINRKTELVKAISEFVVDVDTVSSETDGTTVTLCIKKA